MLDPQEAILRELRAKLLTDLIHYLTGQNHHYLGQAINKYSRFLLIQHVRNLSDAGLPEIPDYRIIFSEIAKSTSISAVSRFSEHVNIICEL